MRKQVCDRCGREIEQRAGARYTKLREEQIIITCPPRPGTPMPDERIERHQITELCERCARELIGLLAVEISAEVDAPGRPGCTTQVAACCEGCVYCLPSPEEGCYNCARARRRVPEAGRDCPWWEAEKEAEA